MVIGEEIKDPGLSAQAWRKVRKQVAVEWVVPKSDCGWRGEVYEAAGVSDCGTQE